MIGIYSYFCGKKGGLSELKEKEKETRKGNPSKKKLPCAFVVFSNFSTLFRIVSQRIFPCLANFPILCSFFVPFVCLVN